MSEPTRPSTDHSNGEPKPSRPIARLHLWQIQPVRDVAVILVILWLVQLGYQMSIVTVPLLLGLLLAYLLEPPIAWLAKRTSRPFAAGAAIAVIAVAFVTPVAVGAWFGVNQGFKFMTSLDDDLAQFIDKTQRFLEYLERDEVKVVIADNGGIAIEPGDPEPEEEQAEEGTPKEDEEDAPASNEEQRAEPTTPPPPTPEDDHETDPEDKSDDDADKPAEAKTEAKDEDAEPEGEEAQAKDRTFIQQWASVLRRGIRENFGTLTGNVAEGGKKALGITWALVLGATGFAFKYLFLTPFFFFFWSISLGSVKEFGAGLIPKKHRTQTLRVIGKMDRAIAAFIRGRLTIAMILAVLYTIAYSLIGVPVPLIFGPAIGLASAVPYLPLIGWPLSMLALAIDQAGAAEPVAWWHIVLWPTVVYFALQTFDDYVLTPLIQGKNVGLSTPVILFAVLGAGALAGVYGVLIAIPIAACIKILITDVIFPRYKSWVEGKAEDPLPIDLDQDTA